MRKTMLTTFLGAFLIVLTGCGMQHETPLEMPVESVMISDSTDNTTAPETTMISTTTEVPKETEPAGILHGIITSAIKQLALLFENPSKERCCVLS